VNKVHALPLATHCRPGGGMPLRQVWRRWSVALGGSFLVHGVAVMALAMSPSDTAPPRPSAELWVTFGEPVPQTLPASPVLDDAPSTPPELLAPPATPLFPDGDVRVSADEVITVAVTAPHPTPPAASGVISTSYWLNVRAAIQGAMRWPAGLRNATSVVLRLQASPYGCVVLEPPPGPGAPDAVRAAARRASDLVARADDEDIPAQAELAIRFDPNPRIRR
jgi:hypothetical protein